MSATYPLTIFYDASCKLCSTEMNGVKQLDLQNQLILTDCSGQDFDDGPYLSDGVSQESMMKCMHVKDATGSWYKGVDAFELIYNTVGLPTIAKLWSHKLTRPFTERAYPWVVRNRHFLSKIGLPFLLKLWGRCAAKKALKRSQACINGICAK